VAVAQPQSPVGEDGLVEFGHVDGRLRAAHPAHRVDQDPSAGQFGGGPVRFGQGGHHLAQRRPERRVEAERGMGALGGEDEEGARLAGGEPGDIGSSAMPPCRPRSA
jgi:hypothetical protein